MDIGEHVGQWRRNSQSGTGRRRAMTGNRILAITLCVAFFFVCLANKDHVGEQIFIAAILVLQGTEVKAARND
jgi:hypothetical protein